MELVEPIDNKIVNYIKKKKEEIRKIESEDGESAGKSDLSAVARNILRGTELEIEEHESDQTFVPLTFPTQGEAILDKLGILVIVGRSGSGNSKCALEILASRKKLGFELFFKLPTLNDWYSVVDPTRNTYIWFDDLFEMTVDKSLRLDKPRFETMLTVTRGKVKVIFTMNDKAHAIHKTDLNTIFKENMFLHIGRERLSREAKLDILKSHLKKNELYICSDDKYLKGKYEYPQNVKAKYISESEVDQILESDPYLGFPLCCYLFSSVNENFRQGISFFKNASKKLIDLIDNIRLSAEVNQFCVLVYAAFQGGKVNPEEIDHELASSILAIMNEDIKEDYEYFLRKGISLLQKSCFFKKWKPEVYHRSIIRASMVSFSKVSIHAKMKVLTSIDPLTFLEVVHMEDLDSPQNNYVVSVPVSLYSHTADILHNRIEKGELSILNSNLLENDAFVNFFLDEMPVTVSVKTFTHACKYNKFSVVKRMKQSEKFETSVSLDTLAKGFELACLSGNREIVEFLNCYTILHSKTMLDILHLVRFNTDLAILLIQKIELSSQTSDTLHSLSKILVREDCHDVLRYLHQHFVCPEDIIHFQANLAGRRRSLPLVKWFIEAFPLKKYDLVVEMMKGACVGGSKSVMKYLYENFLDQVSYSSSDYLRLACESGDPGIVEELLICDNGISKLDIGENLKMACFKGFCQVAHVILTKTKCLTTTDLIDGISNALKGNQIGILGVFQDFYEISENIFSELREQIQQNENAGPYSSMPFTPAFYKNIPSVNISTPCIYRQKNPNQTPKRILQKLLSKEQLQIRMEKYKRCREIWNLSKNENDTSQIQKLLSEEPEIPCELLNETIQKVVSEGNYAIVDVLMDFYPSLCESLLKKFIIGKSLHKNIMQCIHKRYECNFMKYISFARNESIPEEHLIHCLSRYRCLFSPTEIMKAIENLTKSEEKALIKYLLNNLNSITDSYSIHKLFLDACKNGTLCIAKTLLEEDYITNSLITDAFDLCCVYEEVETMEFLLDQKKDIFHEGFILNAIKRCCEDRYLSSLYHLFRFVNYTYIDDTNVNFLLSLLMETKDENVTSVLLLRFLQRSCFERKLIRKLLLRASSENTLIIQCMDNVWDGGIKRIDGTTKVQALKKLIKSKDFKGINLWNFFPDTEKQKTIFFATLFSDKLVEQEFLRMLENDSFPVPLEAILFLIRHQEKDKISRILLRNIKIIDHDELKEQENMRFICDCLPPLSQEIERTIIEWSDFRYNIEPFLTVSSFILMATRYKFSTDTIDRVHANFCRIKDINRIQEFWEKFGSSLNEDCLNNACCNQDLDFLPFLVDRNDFPCHLIKLSEYSLYYILRATLENVHSPVRNKMVNLMYNNKCGATDLNEPLTDSSDFKTVWERLKELFSEEIKDEIVTKLAKICCESSREEKRCQKTNFNFLTQLKEMHLLSDSVVLDCCKMIEAESLSTCATLLKDLPLSQCLEFARIVIDIKDTFLHRYFTEAYLSYRDDNDFAIVCKRWDELNHTHPYYRKRAMAIMDEYANK